MNLISKILTFSLLLVSCEKPVDPSDNNQDLDHGYLILNEGLFQQNNSGLTFWDSHLQQAHQNFFLSVNGMQLGDVANDMIRYGGKLYIVVNNSNIVVVLNAYTGELIEQIQFSDNGTGRSPRNVVSHEGKVYVCSFDGTLAKVDTTSLAIESIVNCGTNPDGLVVQNDKIYISNSGGLNFPNYDSTISVVDLNSFTETKRLEIGVNPGMMVSDNQGDVYVIKRGNYGSDSTRLFRIDSATDTVVQEFQGLNVQTIYSTGDAIYFVHTDEFGNNPKLGIIDASTETVTNQDLFSLSHIQTVYGVHVDPIAQRIYVLDAFQYSSTGSVFVHDLQGNVLDEVNTGYLPRKIVIYE